jgi:hypothetical protein
VVNLDIVAESLRLAESDLSTETTELHPRLPAPELLLVDAHFPVPEPHE